MRATVPTPDSMGDRNGQSQLPPAPPTAATPDRAGEHGSRAGQDPALEFRIKLSTVLAVATVLALGVSIWQLKLQASHTGQIDELQAGVMDKLVQYQEIEPRPSFESVMQAVVTLMDKYQTSDPPDIDGGKNFFIVTDFFGYGHFSFPKTFERYRRFVHARRQDHDIAIVCIDQDRLRTGVLERQFRNEPDAAFWERIENKARLYVDAYRPDHESDIAAGTPTHEWASFRLLADRLQAADELFLPATTDEAEPGVSIMRHDSTELRENRDLLLDAIMETERYLFRDAMRYPDDEILRVNMPSSIHIWYFSEEDAVFALTDESGTNVRGFVSTSRELNSGLRAIAERVWRFAKDDPIQSEPRVGPGH